MHAEYKYEITKLLQQQLIDIDIRFILYGPEKLHCVIVSKATMLLHVLSQCHTHFGTLYKATRLENSILAKNSTDREDAILEFFSDVLRRIYVCAACAALRPLH